MEQLLTRISVQEQMLLTRPKSIATLSPRGCILPRSKPAAGWSHSSSGLPWRKTLSATTGDWSRYRALLDGAHWEGRTMSNTVQLSDVQLLNLSVLMTIQASIKKDPVAACYKFNLRADQAHRVEGLGQQQLQAIVANRGHESLFNFATISGRCSMPSPVSRVPCRRCAWPRLGPPSPAQVNAPTRVGLIGEVRDANRIRRAPHSFSVHCQDLRRPWRQNSHDHLHHRARAQRARPPLLRRRALRSTRPPPDSPEWYHQANLIEKVEATIVVTVHCRMRELGFGPADALVGGFKR